MVFDECHHCMKAHPYNMIMKEFYHRPQQGSGHKPHILGLTATPIPVTKQIDKGEIEGKLLEMLEIVIKRFFMSLLAV